MELSANVVDIPGRRIIPARVVVRDRRIVAIQQLDQSHGDSFDADLPFMLPGFIDAHIHIESSMLVPAEFARLAVRHGTVATVSDPHEIANVMGTEGVDFMIQDGDRVPLKFFFGAPSCVPATEFETAGARIDSSAVADLLARDEIVYLAEMMNYPGVLSGDPEVTRKLAAAQHAGKPIDGHAPGLKADDAIRYIQAGITTDHECTTFAEAEHKIKHGMKILIREGSAAKNFDALHKLIDLYPQSVMLCSDDKHPDELAHAHIDALVRRAVQNGCDLFHVLAAACINPIDHYRLAVGKLQEGDPADFVLVEDLKSFRVLSTYIDGQLVFDRGTVHIDRVETPVINHFQCRVTKPEDFAIPIQASSMTEGKQGVPRSRVRVIQAIDQSLVTESFETDLECREGELQPNVREDVLKLTVVNRYQNATAAKCFIRGFGLQQGAIAASVGHDSHNILAVGTSDPKLSEVVNVVIENRGGVVAASESERLVLPLPVAGIMSNRAGEEVAERYARLDRFAKDTLGSQLSAPFMTLSFMALLVIPALKLSDRGLFDSQRFAPANLHV